ncbi:HAD family hydrolase, partial [Candidatus Bipolaricaulota bacterium]|nr:HAD family hydrolase [Candidatus Bipolaricaulota bacterium]
MNAIDTVFFDMGGTLETLACDATLRRESSKLLLQFLRDSNLDPGCSDDVFYETICAGLKAYRQQNIGSMKELPALRICSDYILKAFAFREDDLRDVCDDFMLRLELSFYRREARPEAIQVLTTLAERGYKLGIISNVMSKECVTTNLTDYGMIDFFEVIVSSAVYGRRKPDPRIFTHAAQQIGSLPETCMHVGDKISRDILGAQRAGLGMAVLIAHPTVDEPEPVEPAPSAVVETLSGILDLLPDHAPASSTHRIPSAPSVKAVFFDAGDILYYRHQRGKYLAEFLKSQSLQPKQFVDSEQKEMKDRAMTGDISKSEYMDFRLRSMGIETSQLEAALEAFQKDSSNVAYFDRGKDTLDELKRRGYKLGIITDTYHSRELKLGWLREIGIDQVWDVFVSSCEEGVKKPNPAIYRTALDQLDLVPCEASFVGHKKSELDG